MDAKILAAYEATRDLSRQSVQSLCYAPFTNLYFDERGNARVCCWNWRVPVGNVLRNTMEEIWNGPVINQLRDRLAAYELTSGCDFCRSQAADGAIGGLKMRKFDQFDVMDVRPRQPKEIEFSISNVCNLECVMCDGLHSSAIRAHRERLPPLPRLYSEAVLQSMRPYLPALNQAKFLGGEPFLISEHFHIWDMMIEDCLTTRCHVTTNGTQYNERICRYLDRLPFGFSVSLDAATKSTYEAIRIRGSFDEVMHNSRRFRDYARERNTSFSFTFCLTRHNWKEFGEFCLMADSWDAAVGVNTVRNPPSLGIYTMPIPEMRAVLNGLEHQSTALERHLKRNRRVWLDEIERLRARVCAAETDRASSQIKHL